MARKKRTSFTDQIREALAGCGVSRYRISREADISEPQMCRFLAGEGLSMQNLDKLADYLGLEIVVRTEERK